MSAGEPIPVTLIGGYLGAGKTTLVNHLLRQAQGRRLAVLVNEFGALPIDADLIEAEGEDLIAIAGGCICCSYGSDLVEALIAMAKRRPRPDHLLIETSGVALPGSVAQSISLVGGLVLDAIVVIADAETVMERACDRYLADTIARQLGEADIVILNKADLVPPGRMDEATRWLAERWPAARVVPSVRAGVDPQVVLGVGAPPRRAGVLRLPGHVTAGYVSVAITLGGKVDAGALARALSGEVDGLVRAKGFVADVGGAIMSLQVVGRRSEVCEARPQVLKDDPFGRIAAIGLAGVMSEREVESVVARHVR